MASSFKSLFARSVTSAGTTMYTVPTSTTSIAIGLTLANITTTTVKVTVNILDPANNVTSIVRDADIIPGQSIIAIGGDAKIVLAEGFKVSISSSNSSNMIHAILSVLEIS